MKKQEYLTEKLRMSGMKGTIHTSIKSMKHEGGTRYAGILRCTDTPERSKSKKIYEDQEGRVAIRRKHYEMTTVYNVVMAEQNEEKLEELLEAFLINLGKGYEDGEGNWVSVDAGEADWVDEEDSVLKSKVAVEIPVTFGYGLYRDAEAVKLPGSPSVKIGED